MSTLGERIKETRTAKGSTQAELAGLVGINLSSLVELENGHSKSIRADVLLTLSKVLEIDPCLLLTGSCESPASLSEQDLQKELSTITQLLDPVNRVILLSIARTLLTHQKPSEKSIDLEKIKGILRVEGMVLDLS